MIVWSGNYGPSGTNYAPTATGGVYDPSLDTWTKMSMVNAPEPRTNAVSVWTGTQMIVYGGVDGNGNPPLNTGAVYDPAKDNWTAISPPPSGFGLGCTVVWTGAGMLVYGAGEGAVYYP